MTVRPCRNSRSPVGVTATGTCMTCASTAAGGECAPPATVAAEGATAVASPAKCDEDAKNGPLSPPAPAECTGCTDLRLGTAMTAPGDANGASGPACTYSYSLVSLVAPAAVSPVASGPSADMSDDSLAGGGVPSAPATGGLAWTRDAARLAGCGGDGNAACGGEAPVYVLPSPAAAPAAADVVMSALASVSSPAMNRCCHARWARSVVGMARAGRVARGFGVANDAAAVVVNSGAD